MNETDLRHKIIKIGKLMYEKGFVAASDGNISARLGPGRILITPSGLHKGLMEPEQLLVVDEDGRPLGPRTHANRHLKPTSELPMHLEVYRQRADVTAVVHAHPPSTVALTIAGVPLADCLLPEVIVMLGLIPTTAYATPSSTENVRAIRDFIRRHDAIVLQRHGSLTVGDSVLQAFMRLETGEQNARIAFMLAQLGARNPLPPDEVEKLLQQREAMGLSHPGERAQFCEVCGVCHTGDAHAPTLKGERGAESRERSVAQNVIAQPDPQTIRMLVSQVVHKT
ncbi:MAG: class II aldolase/adducin family protein, partial [Anaerolineae bacterium]